MGEIDLLLRGAAIGSVLLIGIGIFMGAAPMKKSISILAFLVSIACYLIASSPSLDPVIGSVAPYFVLGAILAPVSFTWAILEILFDDFERKRIWVGVAALTVIPALMADFMPMLMHVRGVVVLLLYLGLLYLAVSSGPDDLVEKRRLFRRVFVGSMALLGIIISIVEIGFDDAALPAALFPIQAASFYILTIVFGLWIFTLSPDIWAAVDGKNHDKEHIPATKDSHLIGQLNAAMTAGVWREEGLTVGALAKQLGVPEHKLRQVINRDLNFRNFSTIYQWAPY